MFLRHWRLEFEISDNFVHATKENCSLQVKETVKRLAEQQYEDEPRSTEGTQVFTVPENNKKQPHKKKDLKDLY